MTYKTPGALSGLAVSLATTVALVAAVYTPGIRKAAVNKRRLLLSKS